MSKSQKKTLRERKIQEEEQLKQQRKSEIDEDKKQASTSTMTPKDTAHSAVKPLMLNEATLKKLNKKEEKLGENEGPPPKPKPASSTEGLPSLLGAIAIVCWVIALALLVLGFYLLDNAKADESLGLVQGQGYESGIQLITLAFVTAWGGVVVMWMSRVLSCLRDASQQTWWSMTYLQHIDEKLTQSLLNQEQTDRDNPDSLFG
jgi:hypothetical protein